jgi:ribosomal protein S27AE
MGLFNFILRIFKKECDHDWIKTSAGRRECGRCGSKQYLAYHKFGDVRMSWKDHPGYATKYGAMVKESSKDGFYK